MPHPQKLFQHLLWLQSLNKQLDKNLVDKKAFPNLPLTQWSHVIFADLHREIWNWKMSFHTELMHFQLYWLLSHISQHNTFRMNSKCSSVWYLHLLWASPLLHFLFHGCGRCFTHFLFCRRGRHLPIDTLHASNGHQAFPLFGVWFVIHLCHSKPEGSKRKFTWISSQMS